VNAQKHVLAWIMWAFALSSRAAGQETTPIPVPVAVGTRMFTYNMSATGPLFSPDGKLLVYSAQDSVHISEADPDSYYRTGVPTQVRDYSILVVSVPDGKTTNLTGGEGSNWAPSWSPDGKFLAFVSDRDGRQAKLWLWEKTTGSVHKVSDVAVRDFHLIQWLPDGKRVLVRVHPEGITPAQLAGHVQHFRDPSLEESRGPGATVRVYRSAAQPRDVEPVIGFDPERDLALIDVTNGTVRRIDSGHHINWFTLSPDGSRVVVVSEGQVNRRATDRTLFDVKIVDLVTGQERVLVRDTHLGFDGRAISWSPDSSRLSYR
jgi:Tol biopolymer transport system component